MRPLPTAARPSRRTSSNAFARSRANRSMCMSRSTSAASSKPQPIAAMNHMRRETLRIGTAQKAQLPGWQAAGKTGTSQDFRDAWFVGYTSHLVTGIWLGNDDSSPTKKATGGGLPVEIWSHFMKPAHQSVPVVGLPELDTAGFSLTAMLTPG